MKRQVAAHGNTVHYCSLYISPHYNAIIYPRPYHLLIVAFGVIGCSSSSSWNCSTVTAGSMVNPRACISCAAPLPSTAFSVLSETPGLPPEEDCKLLFDTVSDFPNFFSPCFLTRSDIAFRRASMYVSYLNISLWI